MTSCRCRCCFLTNTATTTTTIGQNHLFIVPSGLLQNRMEVGTDWRLGWHGIALILWMPTRSLRKGGWHSTNRMDRTASLEFGSDRMPSRRHCVVESYQVGISTSRTDRQRRVLTTFAQRSFTCQRDGVRVGARFSASLPVFPCWMSCRCLSCRHAETILVLQSTTSTGYNPPCPLFLLYGESTCPSCSSGSRLLNWSPYTSTHHPHHIRPRQPQIRCTLHPYRPACLPYLPHS